MFKKIIIFLIVIFLFSFCKDSEERLPQTMEESTEIIFEGPTNLGLIENNAINEASGLAVSQINSDYLWTHNDSGDSPRLFLFRNDGSHLGVFNLKDGQNRDWEDMCIGLGSDNKSYIYIGEIGDNNAVYEDYKIYKIPEPDVNSLTFPANIEIEDYEVITYQYSDGKRDAETLLFDSQTQDLYIVSKRESEVRVYRLVFPYSTSEINTLEKVATLPYTFVVGGDISADGKRILLKTYNKVYFWEREEGQSISEALQKEAIEVTYEIEQQGEAITWSLDGKAYYTLSEELLEEAPLFFYEEK